MKQYFEPTRAGLEQFEQLGTADRRFLEVAAQLRQLLPRFEAWSNEIIGLATDPSVRLAEDLIKTNQETQRLEVQLAAAKRKIIRATAVIEEKNDRILELDQNASGERRARLVMQREKRAVEADVDLVANANPTAYRTLIDRHTPRGASRRNRSLVARLPLGHPSR